MKATSPNPTPAEAEIIEIKQEPEEDPLSVTTPPQSPVNQNSDVLGYSQKHYPMAGGTLFSVFSPVVQEGTTIQPSGENRGRRGRPRGSRKAPGFIQEITGQIPENRIKSKTTSINVSPTVPTVSTATSAALRDLPYMGQLTLNSKPRRGRKPKKADICHLISKNYGISIPKQPEVSQTKSHSETVATETNAETFSTLNTSDISKESQSPSPPPPDFIPVAVKLEEPDYWDMDCNLDFNEQEEPLNLCLRDVDGEERSEGGLTRSSIPGRPYLSEKDLRYVRDGSNVWLMNQLGLFGSFPFNFRDPPSFAHSSLLYDALRGRLQSKKEETAVPQPLPPTSPDARLLPVPVTTPKDETVPNSDESNYDLRSELAKKCKRSPIYIPPTAKAPTEVSICKFKFTGGPKPTLEKKKMLSVDAVGNFHFYSSTPQKSDSKSEAQPSTSQQMQVTPSRTIKKRRSKKSVLRKKLEQTFRDQGFLIQTQQFEAPQGATFCKFRQLKKFTRYLFRSWKEYLPENLQQMAPTEDVLEALNPSDFSRSLTPSPDTPR